MNSENNLFAKVHEKYVLSQTENVCDTSYF
jgi:hypothetical protein